MHPSPRKFPVAQFVLFALSAILHTAADPALAQRAGSAATDRVGPLCGVFPGLHPEAPASAVEGARLGRPRDP